MGSPGPGSPVTGNRIENGDGPGHQEMRSVIAAGPTLACSCADRLDIPSIGWFGRFVFRMCIDHPWRLL